MSTVPHEVVAALKGLKPDYTDFIENIRGANGYLWFATNRISNADVAIKFYAGQPGERRHEEPRQLSAISSPNVLPILDARNVSDDWAYFITPRCDGGDLDDSIRSRPCVHGAIDIILGICAGVSAIHACGMVHRDLKPANIVMDGGTPRIADFGSVRTLNEGGSETTASQHSILYRPPESFSTNRYGRPGDVYQTGLVAYQLLGGALPYDGTQYLTKSQRKQYGTILDPVDQSLFVDDAIRQRAQSGKLMTLASLPPWIDPIAKRFLRRVTCPDPRQRISSMAEVAANLTQLRKSLLNWKLDGVTARLATPGRIIELRPDATGLYVAFQQKAGGFRRIAGLEPSRLADLVKRCALVRSP